LESSESDDDGPFVSMENEAFVYRNQRITFVDGYLDVNNNSIEDLRDVPISEGKICDSCVVQVERAYIFKRLCQAANVILRQKNLPKATNDQLMSEAIEEVEVRHVSDGEINCDGAVMLSCSANIQQQHVGDDNSGQETRVENDDDNVVPIANNKGRCGQRKMVTKSNKPIDKRYACSICFKDYSSENGLRAHNRTKHLIQLYRCRHCAEEFPHASGLSDHHKRVHIRYKCEKCKKSFFTACCLRKHIKMIHLHICDICSTVCKSDAGILAHMNLKHPKKYSCKICDKRYASLTGLWSHSFHHRNFMPFNCTVCDYKGSSSSNFQSHLMLHHGLKYNYRIQGYEKETFEEVLSFVR
jgi:KRAB domain-containing zinc finger protein